MVEVREHCGRTLLWIDGQPVNPVMYCAMDLGRVEAEPEWRRATERFMQHNCDIYLVGVPHRWERKFDLNNFWEGDLITSQPLHLPLEAMDKGPAFVLERRSDAYVMIRFMPRPPKSWFELHPDECVVHDDGERENYPSLASALYAQRAADYCRAYIGFCESRPWGERCLGYVNYALCEGGHGPLCGGFLYDHSPVMTARWRRYLEDKYRTVEALRVAHGDACLTFENAPVPCDRLSGPMPEVSQLLYWQGVEDNAPLRDYLLLMRDLYHANARLVAHASREAAPDKLHIHDAFKLPMQGWSNWGFFKMDFSWPILYPENAAGSGLTDVLELLHEPGMDGVCTPYDYQVRGAGGIFEPEGIADSIALRHNKLFFVEQDVRTYAGGVHDCGMMRDLREFTAVTWRDLATALTRGFMNYYCDHNADYFSDPAMHPVIARQVEVLRQSVHFEHSTVPGIAMILDEYASLETNGSGHVMNEAVMWEEKIGISRCGVPYRIYLLGDLLLDNFPEHRLFYFPNLYRVDERRLALLLDKVLRDGHVVVWGPGSGISDGEKIGAESATRLTGFEFALQNVNYQRRVQICDFAHPVTVGLPADTIYGSAVSYGPVLYPTDGVPLGWAWSKFGGDDVGLALKTFGWGTGAEDGSQPPGAGDWVSVFTTAAPLPAALWRGLARYGGAHVYCEENDVVMADSSLLALHTLKSGPRRLALPGPKRVTDLITGQLVSERTEEVRFEVEAPQTVFYLLED